MIFQKFLFLTPPLQAIIAAAVSTGAQAVHPGYGFLSENCRFAQLLEEKGIAFIGPKEKAIQVSNKPVAILEN